MFSKIIGWLALIIAVAALVLAWIAYEQSGKDLERQIEQQVQQSLDRAGQKTEEAVDQTQDATNEAVESIDAGPDGVDNDDTDTAPQAPDNSR